MLGNLITDKSSMKFDFFMHTIQIIKENGGSISRPDFEIKMSNFIGRNLQNGKGSINRTSYNKSKFPRYFGFVESVHDENGIESLCLTNRGVKLSETLVKTVSIDNSVSYSLQDRRLFTTLIFYSLIFDSFGKNNCGVEQSRTDVEPPKVLFKTLYSIGHATAKEIFYILYGLNGHPKNGKLPIHDSFENALNKVLENRINHFSYNGWASSWKIKNLLNDCKIINIFAENGFGFISSSHNEDTGEIEYSLSKDLSKEYMEYIERLSPFYNSLFYVQPSKSDQERKYAQEWIKTAIYGKYSSDRNVFHIDMNDIHNSILENQTFVKAIKAAFTNPRLSIYLEFNSSNYDDIISTFAGCDSLLERINDYRNIFHGWSQKSFRNEFLYREIKAVAAKSQNGININQALEKGCVRLPSNFNIIGV